MQFKTNCKVPKKELLNYLKIENKYNCKCLWINYIKKEGVFLYNSEYPKGIIMS